MPHTAAIDDLQAAGEETSERPIIFFDGHCGLCSGFVNFAMRRDDNQRLTFAPLQGATAEQKLPADDRNVDSVIFFESGRVQKRSAAVVAALKTIGGVWSLVAAVLWLIPGPLRDLGYRIVAANRFRFFGRSDTCRMPTPQERGRILP